MDAFVEVHASSLADNIDCARRQAARTLYKEVAAMGHLIGHSRPSAGAAVGQAIHSMMAEIFRTKLAIGEISWVDVEAAVEKIFPDFLAYCSKQNEEVIWDETTNNAEVARKQLKAMANAFLPIADLTKPAKVEHEYEWILSPLGTQAIPVKLIGRLDVMDVRGEIQDHKTGVSMPAPYEQLGAYSLLAKYHDENVTSLRMNYVPRKGPNSLNSLMCRSIILPLDECERAAWNAIKTFQRQYEDWLETGDPYSFPARNSSMVCGAKYCCAFGTTWCKVGKLA